MQLAVSLTILEPNLQRRFFLENPNENRRTELQIVLFQSGGQGRSAFLGDCRTRKLSVGITFGTLLQFRKNRNAGPEGNEQSCREHDKGQFDQKWE